MRTGFESRTAGPMGSGLAFASENAHGIALALLLLLHVLAVFHFFPPAEWVRSTPILTVDYPVHTYRVHMYREGIRSVGAPWGYDPAISAGTVMSPGQDLGAKSIQVVGLAAWFLEPGAVVRLFLLATLFAYPLFINLACVRLGLRREIRLWTLAAIVGSTWILSEITQFLEWGLVTFFLASFLSVVVLALFLRVIEAPSAKSYLTFLVGATLLLLAHVAGPIIMLPAMGLLALSTGGVPPRWRTAIVISPAIVFMLNAFWLVPYLLSRDLPVPSGAGYAYPPDTIMHLTFASFADFLPILSSPLVAAATVAGVALAGYGVHVLAAEIGSQKATAIGLTCLTGVLLVFFGSFVPGVRAIQPLRFIVPALAFMCIPVGAVLSRIPQRIAVRSAPIVAGMAGLGLLGATITENPAPLDASPPPNAVSTFIETQTTPSDRLLIQSNDGYNHGGYETKIYPVVFGREVIGSNFQLVHDPPQFLSTMLLGREIGAWEPEALRDAIERWGVSKVLTVTNEAERLISRTFGEPGIAVGEHRAFEVSGPVSRFLRGDGRISVAVNRMQLSDVHDDAGLVVLRYRYHPAWRSSEGVVICSFSIPEDPAGFIALVDPPSSTTLTFDPWALFSAPWPEPGGPGDLACPTASAPHGGE